jgi:hypothetical protein
MAHKAFISSTYEDLRSHRAHVIEILRKSGFQVDPMEDWGAASDEPKAFSQARVNGCDLCILLVAFRRGFIPPGSTRSITQLEYDYALAHGMDVLVFMLDESAPWPRTHDSLDSDPEMRPWRSELLLRHGVSSFNQDPASIEIAPALLRWQSARHKAPSLREILETRPEKEHVQAYLRSYFIKHLEEAAGRFREITILPNFKRGEFVWDYVIVRVESPISNRLGCTTFFSLLDLSESPFGQRATAARECINRSMKETSFDDFIAELEEHQDFRGRLPTFGLVKAIQVCGLRRLLSKKEINQMKTISAGMPEVMTYDTLAELLDGRSSIF